jgi:hypothetical protein
MEIIVGEFVVNKLGEVGKITAFDAQYITVDYQSRTATLLINAFEQGHIRYVNTDLQKKIEEEIAQAKLEAAQKAEEARIAAENKKQAQKGQVAKAPVSNREITFESVKLMLEPAPYSLNSVARSDKALVGDIFEQCNRDIKELYEKTNPRMTYPKITSHSRSKHCTGFLCRYSGSLVFRVFSRNDVYKKRIRTGVTVMESTTTEILRIIWVEDKVYSFSKNFSTYNGYFYNTVNATRWIAGGMTQGIMLNDVIRCCDCGYLNDTISEAGIDVNCQQYLRLLIPALHNNKAEIVFKNKSFFSAFRIKYLVGYLEEFTPKQIDFASKNDVLNTLPIIKQYGISDLDILQDMELLMRKRWYGVSVYDVLAQRFAELGFDDADLGKKLINFTKKVDFLDAGVYYDYIRELGQCPGVTAQDFFDKNYIERHNILHRELMERYERERAEMLAIRYQRDENQVAKEKAAYEKIAKELSWIDRKENGYFITVPKTIDEFMDEGMMQHNCVYSNRYYARVIAKQSIIVFLRKEEKTSFVTIEFDYETFEIAQALGKCNRRIDPELRQYIVKLGKQLYYERHTHQ